MELNNKRIVSEAISKHLTDNVKHYSETVKNDS